MIHAASVAAPKIVRNMAIIVRPPLQENFCKVAALYVHIFTVFFDCAA
jgi:hypothetical protein